MFTRIKCLAQRVAPKLFLSSFQRRHNELIADQQQLMRHKAELQLCSANLKAFDFNLKKLIDSGVVVDAAALDKLLHDQAQFAKLYLQRQELFEEASKQIATRRMLLNLEINVQHVKDSLCRYHG